MFTATSNMVHRTSNHIYVDPASFIDGPSSSGGCSFISSFNGNNSIAAIYFPIEQREKKGVSFIAEDSPQLELSNKTAHVQKEL